MNISMDSRVNHPDFTYNDVGQRFEIISGKYKGNTGVLVVLYSPDRCEIKLDIGGYIKATRKQILLTELRVNIFTTIKDFKRLNHYEFFMKFGTLSKYQKFKGKLNGEAVKGFICLEDNQIYKLQPKN